MKMIKILLTLLLTLTFSASAEQLYTKNAFGEYVPVLRTNESGPFISGPGVDFLKNLSTVTNWGVATFGIMEPKSGDKKCLFGAGAVFLYNINKYVATGIGIDWLEGQVTMPSGQLQFQLPFTIGGTNGLTVTPFGFTGAATPIGGMGEDNGGVIGLFGAGLDVKIYKGFGAFYAIEQRTERPTQWHLFGLRYSKAF